MTNPREAAAATDGPDATLSQNGAVGQSREEIQAHIEETRRELGETVDALGAKLDVKTRAKDQATATKQRVRQEAGAIKQRAALQVGLARQQLSEAAARAKDAATDERGDVRAVVPVGAAVALAVTAGIAGVLVRRRR